MAQEIKKIQREFLTPTRPVSRIKMLRVICDVYRHRARNVDTLQAPKVRSATGDILALFSAPVTIVLYLTVVPLPILSLLILILDSHVQKLLVLLAYLRVFNKPAPGELNRYEFSEVPDYVKWYGLVRNTVFDTMQFASYLFQTLSVIALIHSYSIGGFTVKQAALGLLSYHIVGYISRTYFILIFYTITFGDMIRKMRLFTKHAFNTYRNTSDSFKTPKPIQS